MSKQWLISKIRFLKPGWWLLHFIAIATVYTLGHLLWR